MNDNKQWHEVFGNEVSAQEIVALANSDVYRAGESASTLALWLAGQYRELYPNQDIPTLTQFIDWATSIRQQAQVQSASLT